MPLHRSLEDFLLLEHHAKHQATMLYLSQPPELRAQTGQTAVVRCERYDRGDRTDLGVFVLSDVHGTPMSREEMGDLRLQEGTWVVVNTLCNDEGQPRAAWEIVRGRLGIISAISDAQITVHLQRLTFKPTPFRYPHRRTDLQPGQVYTLDEMVDDLNADKYLEACQHAASNPLYHWLNDAYTDPQAPKPLRVIRPSRLRAGLEFADLAAQAQQPSGLTAAQRAIVGGYYPEHVLVVQGPPGTGKSHTLGLAILARAWALQECGAAVPGRRGGQDACGGQYCARQRGAAVTGAAGQPWPGRPARPVHSTSALPKSATTWMSRCRQGWKCCWPTGTTSRAPASNGRSC